MRAGQQLVEDLVFIISTNKRIQIGEAFKLPLVTTDFPRHRCLRF